MGCTVSGIEKRNCEWFVCGQEKSIIKAITSKVSRGNNSLHFSTCGKELEQSSLKSSKKSDELGKITTLRTTHSGRNFSSKTFKELPRMKGSSNSNELDARGTSFKNLKELSAMDHTGNKSYLKVTYQRSSCNDSFKKVPWKVKSKKHERNNGWDTSEAEPSCNFQQDTTGNGKACYNFYISDVNNNPTSNTFNMPYVSEFDSCMHSGSQVDIV